jgi:hypothetical protein
MFCFSDSCESARGVTAFDRYRHVGYCNALTSHGVCRVKGGGFSADIVRFIKVLFIYCKGSQQLGFPFIILFVAISCYGMQVANNHTKSAKLSQQADDIEDALSKEHADLSATLTMFAKVCVVVIAL